MFGGETSPILRVRDRDFCTFDGLRMVVREVITCRADCKLFTGPQFGPEFLRTTEYLVSSASNVQR